VHTRDGSSGRDRILEARFQELRERYAADETVKRLIDTVECAANFQREVVRDREGNRWTWDRSFANTAAAQAGRRLVEHLAGLMPYAPGRRRR
jgi:hypothetical protein